MAVTASTATTLIVFLPLAAVTVLANLAAQRFEAYRKARRKATGRVTDFVGEMFGAAQAVPWAIVADVVEADELKTGKRREGIYAGYLVFFRKMASAFAIFVVGQVLYFTGGHKGRSCDILGISRPALDRKIKKYGLDLPDKG